MSVRAWGLIVVVTVACISHPARAFLCTTVADGPSIAWSTRHVELHRSGVGHEVDAPAIDDAIAFAGAAWTDVTCSDIELVAGAATTTRVVGFDWAKGSTSPVNQNIVVFRNDDVSDPVDRWLHAQGALAITTVTFESRGGRILDADIEVDDANFRFSACDPGPGCAVHFDLKNTLTHETGHVLGLDHPPSDQPGAAAATMFASAPEGETSKRTLSSDDEDGLCLIYPMGGSVGDCVAQPRLATPDVVFVAAACGATPTGTAAATAPVWMCLALLGCRRRSSRDDPAFG
jgi:hypothetical protein